MVPLVYLVEEGPCYPGTSWIVTAFVSATGEVHWRSRREDLPGRQLAKRIAVSGDGQRVYVTGKSGRLVTTVAYDASTGTVAMVCLG